MLRSLPGGCPGGSDDRSEPGNSEPWWPAGLGMLVTVPAGDQPAVRGAAQGGGQGGLDARGLGVAPGATQVVGGRLGQVAHGHAVAHLFTPGPVGAEQAHDPTLPLRVRAPRTFDKAETDEPDLGTIAHQVEGAPASRPGIDQ